MRLLPLGGIAGPVVFAAASLVAALARPGYSQLQQFISELGATGTPNAALMNYLGFVPTGLLLIGLAASVPTRLPRTKLTTLATLLIALFGTGIVVAGLMPCDVGCPQGSGTTANQIHNQVSPLAFLAVIAAAVAMSAHFRLQKPPGSLWLYSAVTAVVAVGFMIGTGLSVDTRSFTGLWQRLFLSVVFLWCAVLGWHLFRLDQPESPIEPSPTGS